MIWKSQKSFENIYNFIIRTTHEPLRWYFHDMSIIDKKKETTLNIGNCSKYSGKKTHLKSPNLFLKHSSIVICSFDTFKDIPRLFKATSTNFCMISFKLLI